MTTSTDESTGTSDSVSATTDESVSAADADHESDYTHRAPNVMAAPGEATGSGDVDLHGLEGEDLAEHHLEHARRLADEILEGQETGPSDRSKIEQLREHLDRAFTALDGKSS